MVTFRKLTENDVENFWDLLNTLDMETNYMMYEPKERARCTDIQKWKEDIHGNAINGNDFLLIALEGNKMVGYIRAERGKFNRTFHTAYIVIGILKEYCGKGIGTILFQNLDKWAKENGILRLELTVECHNKAARRLYEKIGFEVEGVRKKSMLVDGAFVDECYMAKML